ncbi:glutathione peroxidase [Demequina aurantiaca]|uniref:glutathione peroxidase n=1 Tax=Demequina aurantiaca TaxID=676200 RepID=UPI00078091B3|nr:glutathione peroxidase [Demequina aurantiaca]
MSHDTALAHIQLTTIDGTATTLGAYSGKALLIVNVASRCGLSPQYEQLEELQKTYEDRGFTVLGFPSNQFHQELGSTDAIQEYCSTTWGVTFPMFETIKVNGRHRHPLYEELTAHADADGKAGKIKWNFEKFVVAPDGTVSRFRPKTKPDAPEVIAAIEAALPAEQATS